MNFFNRIGEGASIMVRSLGFPFKHPILFGFAALFLVASGLTGVASNGVLFSNSMVSISLWVIGVFFQMLVLLGVTRTAIACMQGKSIKFWQSMSFDGASFPDLSLLAGVGVLLGIVWQTIVLGNTSLMPYAIVASLAILPCQLFFLPIMAYETQNPFVIIGRSVKLCFRLWVEIISGIITLFCIFISVAVVVGLIVGIVIALSNPGLIKVGASPMMAFYIPVVALFVLMGSGGLVFYPALYLYIKNNRVNPLKSQSKLEDTNA